jgi:hypothetical protein
MILYRLVSLTLGFLSGLLFRFNRPKAEAIGLARKGWGG